MSIHYLSTHWIVIPAKFAVVSAIKIDLFVVWKDPIDSRIYSFQCQQRTNYHLAFDSRGSHACSQCVGMKEDRGKIVDITILRIFSFRSISDYFIKKCAKNDFVCPFFWMCDFDWLLIKNINKFLCKKDNLKGFRMRRLFLDIQRKLSFLFLFTEIFLS